MDIKLQAKSNLLKEKINITGSKSESNRALLLKALYPSIDIQNLSNSDDTRAMQEGLNSSNKTIDIHHAGTAMRFLTAYLSFCSNKTTTLTGSKRMQERPIKILVDGLKSLGADITYLKKEGYPPLLITGKSIEASEVELQANISSQYISALMLIAPKLKNGLKIHLKGEITSTPYIQMTMRLLSTLGIPVSFENNVINIAYCSKVQTSKLVVESDWSSASYYYSMASLADIGSEITLFTYIKNSLQGDSMLSDIYTALGVNTIFKDNHIILKKVSTPNISTLNLDLSDTPDIAQTIAVSCFGLNIPCNLKGLHTLKIKETDRLIALKNELTKLGATLSITEDSLNISHRKSIRSNISINTYHDHRMAMAFAPLCLKVPITILDAEEVNKSYPGFWNDLTQTIR